MVVEPLVGYRIFRVNNDTNTLSPLYIGGVGEYKPGEKMKAVCGRWDYYDANGRPVSRKFYLLGMCSMDGVQVPSERCICGIHAYKDMNGTLSELSHLYSIEFSNIPLVIAKVNLWGKIQEHLDGYRAQFCYPSKFYTNSGEFFEILGKHNIQSLANAWGVEVDHNAIPA